MHPLLNEIFKTAAALPRIINRVIYEQATSGIWKGVWNLENTVTVPEDRLQEAINGLIQRDHEDGYEISFVQLVSGELENDYLHFQTKCGESRRFYRLARRMDGDYALIPNKDTVLTGSSDEKLLRFNPESKDWWEENPRFITANRYSAQLRWAKSIAVVSAAVAGITVLLFPRYKDYLPDDFFSDGVFAAKVVVFIAAGFLAAIASTLVSMTIFAYKICPSCGRKNTVQYRTSPSYCETSFGEGKSVRSYSGEHGYECCKKCGHSEALGEEVYVYSHRAKRRILKRPLTQFELLAESTHRKVSAKRSKYIRFTL